MQDYIPANVSLTTGHLRQPWNLSRRITMSTSVVPHHEDSTEETSREVSEDDEEDEEPGGGGRGCLRRRTRALGKGNENASR